MPVSYKKLWKLLIDHNMNKGDLAKEAKMSPNTIAKLGKNETVSMDILVRICEVFKCDIGDIVEVVNPLEKTISAENDGVQGEIVERSDSR